MSQLSVGQSVRVDDDYYSRLAGKIVEVAPKFGHESVGETSVYFDGEGYYVKTSALTELPEVGPSVSVRETIVVSFGDDEHELTVEEANALIRSLELAVA